MAINLFNAGGVYFTAQRLPGYPTYDLSWEQTSGRSTGADTLGYAPYVQELIMKLSWAGMVRADKENLETFYKTTAKGMAVPFTYTNPRTFPSGVAVRFADASLPTMTEISWERYKVDLSLRVDTNFPQLDSPGTPPTMTGNRFAIGSIARSFPGAIRPNTGHDITKPQTLERNTAGAPVIYDKSRLTLQQHRLSLVLDSAGFSHLQEIFFSYIHGQHHQFVWTDWTETARTVRLSTPKITVQQVGCNRFTTEIPLTEEL